MSKKFSLPLSERLSILLKKLNVKKEVVDIFHNEVKELEDMIEAFSKKLEKEKTATIIIRNVLGNGNSNKMDCSIYRSRNGNNIFS